MQGLNKTVKKKGKFVMEYKKIENQKLIRILQNRTLSGGNLERLLLRIAENTVSVLRLILQIKAQNTAK